MDARGAYGHFGHDRVLISLAEPHFINGCIKRAGKLSVNLVSEDMLPAADEAGFMSGNKTDKSELFAWGRGEHGAPIIEKAPLSIECTVADVYNTKGFESFICTIDGTYVDKRHLDGQGKIDYDTLKPVLFEFPTYSYLKTGDMLGKCLSFRKGGERGRV